MNQIIYDKDLGIRSLKKSKRTSLLKFKQSNFFMKIISIGDSHIAPLKIKISLVVHRFNKVIKNFNVITPIILDRFFEDYFKRCSMYNSQIIEFIYCNKTNVTIQIL